MTTAGGGVSSPRHAIIVVAGPTATGKSALALDLARSFGAEIVALDSVQAYRGADIGAAKPSPAERGGIPHHGLDIWDPAHPGDTAQFLRVARAAIAAVRARGKPVIVVGGTGLYLTGLLHGLVDLPGADRGLRDELERLTSAALVDRLTSVDPVSAARIHPHDRVRLVRAIECSERSGEPASVRRARHAHSETYYGAAILVPLWERAALYRRIDTRAAAMVCSGLLEEAASLLARDGVGPLGAIGYAEARAVLRGEAPRADLVPTIARATRRFAKRQMTFWRNEPGKRGWRIRPTETEVGEVLAQGRSATEEGASFRVLPWDRTTLAGELGSWLKDTSRHGGIETWYLSAARLGLGA
jgi:tRNA dimethylallyltransferase